MDLDLEDNVMEQLTILPFDDDQLWSVIENKHPNTYTINVAKSYENLKDKMLYYISNLELDVVFDFTDCDYELKKALLLQYLSLNRLYYNQQLLFTIGSILLTYKTIGFDESSILDRNQTIDFINENIDIVRKCTNFLDSVLLYTVYQFKNLHPYFDKSKYETVKDSTIPLNLVHLLKLSMFGLFYTDVITDSLKWYEIQFTCPIYNNQSITEFVFDKNSVVAIAGYHIDQKLLNDKQNVSHS